MASDFGTIREDVNDSQDTVFFELEFTDRKLGKDFRAFGAVQPLTKADIVPVPKRVEVEIQPRYKALIALCLCAGLAGAFGIALITNSANSPSESIAYAAKRKGTPRPPGAN